MSDDREAQRSYPRSLQDDDARTWAGDPPDLRSDRQVLIDLLLATPSNSPEWIADVVLAHGFHREGYPHG